MVSLLGGRAAEELVFNDITSGAASDLERVTQLARNMVTRLGMSDTLGPMVYGKKEELIFLGRELSEQRDYSEAVAEKIDAEVKQLVSASYQKAKDILQKYRAELTAVAEKLLEQETNTGAELDKVFPTPNSKNAGLPVKK